MTIDDVRARTRRLEELVKGLTREVVQTWKCDDPLLYLERKTYLVGLQTAIAGLEDARIALVKAHQRLGGEGAIAG